VGGVSSGGQVLMGGSKQVVEDQLVAAAQGAPEAGEGLLFSKEDLGNGRQCTTHNCPQALLKCDRCILIIIW
jgi:hypothetical protein